MKPRFALAAVLIAPLLASTVQAQWPPTVYVAPVPAVAPAATVYSGPVTVVQRPAIAAYPYPSAPVVYRPTTVLPAPTTVYRPVVGVAPTTVYHPAVGVAPVPISVYRPAAVAVPVAPAYTFYSPLTGWEVRVPGQPIRNFFRAIIP